MNFTFKKNERLCSKTTIDTLFEKGKFINGYPLRLIYLEHTFTDDTPGQVILVVAKRKLKKAVDRNRTRRLMREAYRLAKHNIYAIENKKFAMALSFTGKEELTLDAATKGIEKIITKLVEIEAK